MKHNEFELQNMRAAHARRIENNPFALMPLRDFVALHHGDNQAAAARDLGTTEARMCEWLSGRRAGVYKGTRERFITRGVDPRSLLDYWSERRVGGRPKTE